VQLMIGVVALAAALSEQQASSLNHRSSAARLQPSRHHDCRAPLDALCSCTASLPRTGRQRASLITSMPSPSAAAVLIPRAAAAVTDPAFERLYFTCTAQQHRDTIQLLRLFQIDAY